MRRTDEMNTPNYSPDGLAGGVPGPFGRRSIYQDHTDQMAQLIGSKNGTWDGINAESVARMRLQNRFQTGLDIARYTAAIMRADMAAYDANPADYTQSLGAWHGFIAQQQIIAVKKHFGTTKRRYIYLSGWMVAALRSEFGPLPDQSMHEKTTVPDLIREIYTFLRQADSRELGGLYREIDAARKAGDHAKEADLLARVENYETHVVPIIADIDAGFGNAEATYLLAKKMIEAGACALQIENQVSDEKQCGHQDGKVTVPHEDFIAKVRAVRYAFLELGVEDGVIVTRTDSLGAGLTKQIAVSHTPGDLGDQYNSFLDCEEITAENARNGDVILNRDGKLLRPKRLPSNLFQFRAGTGADRCVLDAITSLQNGADLLWIETEKPNVEQIASMMDRVRAVIPNAKLAYNNSPSFNWTLSFRQQVFDDWAAEGKNVVAEYDRPKLMSVDYDTTPLAIEADERIRTFQADAAKRAGIFHHLITLPTYHTEALAADNLSKEYFGTQGMLGYVLNVQRQELRQGIACVRHQNMAGSDIGDDHKEYFAGEAALKAGGVHNTMSQFA
jgi:isocitrate lyase